MSTADGACASPDYQRLFDRYPESTVVNRLVVERIAVPGICVA